VGRASGCRGFQAFDTGSSPSIPEPDETPEPDEPVGFVEPKKLDEKLPPWKDAANFYHDLLMSNENRFKHIWEYLARRGVEKETISKFNIGYAPPYSDEQYQGRALIDGFLPRFEKDHEAFDASRMPDCSDF
jgi:DNA primase